MQTRKRPAAAPCSRGSQQGAADIRLEDLPSVAVERIAQLASTPSTPATCLLPRVCRGWRAAVDRVQPILVDIEVDLGPFLTQPPDVDLEAVSCLLAGHGRTTRGRAAAVAAAAATAASSAVPAALLRGRQLATWLAKYRGRVRSLCIPSCILSVDDLAAHGPPPPIRQGWAGDLTSISKALTAPQRAPASGPHLPHLVQLELPVLGLPGTSAFLKGLAACTGLQQLVLGPPHKVDSPGVSCDEVGAALEPLKQLRTLHLIWPSHAPVEGACLAGLLWQLPPSLEEVQLEGLRCVKSDSIPLSCMTHLVNLQAWDRYLSSVPLVVDDPSSSGGGGGGSGKGSGAEGLMALTRLRCLWTLRGSDARLQLPNLRDLDLNSAEPAAWQQLWGRKHLSRLRHMSLTRDVHNAAGLGGLTQLQHLDVLLLMEAQVAPADVQPWAAAIASLTRLKFLLLPACVVIAGGPTLLTPLAQLEQLWVDRWGEVPAEFYPADAQGWEASPGGAVVKVVAAAVGAGWGPLQCLRLLCMRSSGAGWKQEAQQVCAAARESLPGLEVLTRGEEKEEEEETGGAGDGADQ